jgi:hypothetical protein
MSSEQKFDSRTDYDRNEEEIIKAHPEMKDQIERGRAWTIRMLHFYTDKMEDVLNFGNRFGNDDEVMASLQRIRELLPPKKEDEHEE